MSSIAERAAPQVADGAPFASFAQIVRMLLPSVDKLAFYDAQGAALWISDGVEEPELRGRIEMLLAQHAPHRTAPPGYSNHPPHRATAPICALPIHDARRSLLGALAVVQRPASGEPHSQRASTVESLLAPLIEIIAYSWESGRRRTPSPPLHSQQMQAQPAATPAPAVLRRTLTLATQRVRCAFGAIVAADRPFTLSRRLAPEESDLAMNAAIDAVREHMLRLMQVRREPLIANRAANGAAYKFLAHPVRSSEGRLAALILLFRSAYDSDFAHCDVEALSDIAAELSDDVIGSLLARATPVQQLPQPLARSVSLLAGDSTRAQPSAATARLRVQPITMEARIRAALRADDLDLYAQRITPLREPAEPRRFEVLLRMHDADKLCAPSAFFGAAADCELMPELDRWVIRNLLRRLREHAAAVRAARWEFCVNLAAQSLTSSGFSEFVVAEVCRSGVPAGRLVFELSESHALEHQDAVDVLAARLRDVGCRIALDNCRAGFDTLSTLRKWPVSCLKIDGSLIRDVEINPRSEALVRALVQLAGGVGVETVAECVETAGVCAKLIDIGVDYAQGFHLGAPQPIERLFISG